MKDRIIKIIDNRLRIEDESLYHGIIESIAVDIDDELGGGMTMGKFYDMLCEDLPERFIGGHVSVQKNGSSIHYFANVYDSYDKKLIQTGATPNADACIEMIRTRVQQIINEDGLRNCGKKEMIV